MWKGFQALVYEATAEVCGFSRKRNHDWFDENCGNWRPKDKLTMWYQQIRHYSPPKLGSTQSDLKSRELRNMENEWWMRKTQEIQQHDDTNNSQSFYGAIKSA